MSETPNITLSLGGQIVATSTKSVSSTNEWETCYNHNYVYVNSNAADNTDKTQYFIDPNNTKILLGKAKLKSVAWQNPSEKYYNVYVKTALEEVVNPSPNVKPPTIYPTQNITALGQGKGIDLSYETKDNIDSIIISISDDVVTKDNFDSILQKSTSDKVKVLTTLQEHELKNLLTLLTVEFDDEIDTNNQLIFSETNANYENIFAFSFQFKSSSTIENKTFNCLRIKKQTNTQPIYCVIRECQYQNYQEFQYQFARLPLFADNNEQEFSMDKFEFLYTNSKPIALSLNGVTVNDKSDKSEWYFPNELEIRQNAVYLVTFHSNKSLQITTDNTRLINIGGNPQGEYLSMFMRRYNKNFVQNDANGKDQSSYIVNAEFCKKQPIGVKFK